MTLIAGRTEIRAADLSSLRCLRMSEAACELGQTLPEDAVKSWERVDHVGKDTQRRARPNCQYELANDLARTRSDERGADQHLALAIGDQFQRALVKVVDLT